MEVGDSPMGDGALLMFSHRDFDRSNPAIPVVTPVWAQVMLRLKDVAESGVDNPFFVVAA